MMLQVVPSPLIIILATLDTIYSAGITYKAEEEGGAFLRIVLFDLHYHKSKNLKYIFVIFSPGAW